MKKSVYRAASIDRSKGQTWKGGWGIRFALRPAGSKLAKKASRNRVGNSRGGIVSRACENIAKSKRR